MASFNGWQHVPARPDPAAEEKIASCELCLFLSAETSLCPEAAQPRQDHAGGRGSRPGGGPKGLPFVAGREGWLDEALDEAGLKREDVLHNQCHHMRPPQNRKPKEKGDRTLSALSRGSDGCHPPQDHLPDGEHCHSSVLGVVGVTVLRGRILSDRFSCDISSGRPS